MSTPEAADPRLSRESLLASATVGDPAARRVSAVDYAAFSP